MVSKGIELAAKAGKLGFELGVFCFEAGDDLLLRAAHIEAGSSHALFNASLRDIFLVALLYKSSHCPIHHVTQANGCVANLFVRPAEIKRAIVLVVAVLLAKGTQFIEPLFGGDIRAGSPFGKPMLFQVILIIFEQLAIRALGNAEQPYLNFKTGLPIRKPFGNVLLHGTRRLYHLVYRAVAITR